MVDVYFMTSHAKNYALPLMQGTGWMYITIPGEHMVLQSFALRAPAGHEVVLYINF